MPDIIHASTPQHLEHARALLNEYAAGLGFSLCFEGFSQELAALPGKYAPPQGRLLLAYDGPEPVGCVALRPNAPGVCEMKRLYVKPTHRAAGLGRRLAIRLLDEAIAAGYTHMRLDSTQDMKAAHALYRSLGFYLIDRYNEDHIPHTIWMEADLRAPRPASG